MLAIMRPHRISMDEPSMGELTHVSGPGVVVELRVLVPALIAQKDKAGGGRDRGSPRHGDRIA